MRLLYLSHKRTGKAKAFEDYVISVLISCSSSNTNVNWVPMQKAFHFKSPIFQI